jgi:hypothetical protein
MPPWCLLEVHVMHSQPSQFSFNSSRDTEEGGIGDLVYEHYVETLHIGRAEELVMARERFNMVRYKMARFSSG